MRLRDDPSQFRNCRFVQGLRGPDGRWEVSLWSRNVFDKLTYYTKGVSENGGVFYGLTGDPRTFGITFRTRS